MFDKTKSFIQKKVQKAKERRAARVIERAYAIVESTVGEAYVDTESLARQYRVCGRGQRSFSVQQMLLGKSSAYRAAKKRLDVLFHTINHVYTSLPYQSWTISSDHYVFGMRHILI